MNGQRDGIGHQLNFLTPRIGHDRKVKTLDKLLCFHVLFSLNIMHFTIQTHVILKSHIHHSSCRLSTYLPYKARMKIRLYFQANLQSVAFMKLGGLYDKPMAKK